jgi:predicted Zn-ribbon and HTH transcriptional regulator
MSKCPKCGSYKIFGPKFDVRQGAKGCQEVLVYTCWECGYSATELPLDARERAGKERKPAL